MKTIQGWDSLAILRVLAVIMALGDRVRALGQPSGERARRASRAAI